MKASILIASYLLKDIWHRWLENPGPFLARFSVACLLALLLFAMGLAFFYSEYLLRDRIDSLGLHNVYIQRSVPAEAQRNPQDPLGPQLTALNEFGTLIRLQRVHQLVELDVLPSATLFLYEDASLVMLAEVIGIDAWEGGLVLSRNLPPGMPVGLKLPLIDIEVFSAHLPADQIPFLDNRTAVLLPESTYGWLGESGYMETLLFRGDSQRISNFNQLVAAIEAVVYAGGDESGGVQSTLGLLEQLQELQDRQGAWAQWLGLAAGAVVALVYGAITILEYRQNEFIAALIRSFGVSGSLVLLRYLVEGCLLVAAAGLLAAFALEAVIPNIVHWADVPQSAIPALQAFLWSPGGVGEVLPWLVTGGLLSVVPVLFALRKPVGRILG